jgi:hypothetical protein
LGGKRSMHSVPRVVEGRAKGIACGLKNVAVLRGNAIPQYIVVSGKRLPHGIMVRFPQPRAALDVGEEERDCASRPR